MFRLAKSTCCVRPTLYLPVYVHLFGRIHLPVFSKFDFIMVEPTHPGNVGAAARALKTMGFSQLVLVNPRVTRPAANAEAVALASGALDVLEGVRVFDTLAEALGDATLAFALTARGRDLGPPSCDVRKASVLASEHLSNSASEGGKVAVVFGTERSGLTNDQLALCQWACHIPANPRYSSLNVAQAIQVVAWEMRYSLLEGLSLGDLSFVPAEPGPAPAPGNQVQAFLQHWEEALTAVGFLDPAHPKKLMLRMRHLFTRAQMSREEVDMMRGVCTAMLVTAHGRRPKTK